MLSMAFPHVLLRFSNGIVNNFIVSFPLHLVYAQDVGRKPDRDARKTAESGFGGARSAPVAGLPLIGCERGGAGSMGSKGRAGLGQRQILRLSSHCSAFTFSNIRHFTPLRMTKWGDARRSLKRRFPSYRQPSLMGKANRWRLCRDR